MQSVGTVACAALSGRTLLWLWLWPTRFRVPTTRSESPRINLLHHRALIMHDQVTMPASDGVLGTLGFAGDKGEVDWRAAVAAASLVAALAAAALAFLIRQNQPTASSAATRAQIAVSPVTPVYC